jgi:hypothetical protein
MQDRLYAVQNERLDHRRVVYRTRCVFAAREPCPPAASRELDQTSSLSSAPTLCRRFHPRDNESVAATTKMKPYTIESENEKLLESRTSSEDSQTDFTTLPVRKPSSSRSLLRDKLIIVGLILTLITTNLIWVSFPSTLMPGEGGMEAYCKVYQG